MSADLLVVTVDGFGKRTSVEQYRRTARGRLGVRTIADHRELAAGLLVREQDEVVLATSAAKVERLAVSDIPRQGRGARGVRLIRLIDGERVTAATVALDPSEGNDTPQNAFIDISGVSATAAAVNEPAVRVGRVVLRDGESFAAAVVLHPAVGPTGCPGRRPAVPKDAWEATAVHQHSDYWCGRCGAGFDDPGAVYQHLDAAHAEDGGSRAARDRVGER